MVAPYAENRKASMNAASTKCKLAEGSELPSANPALFSTASKHPMTRCMAYQVHKAHTAAQPGFVRIAHCLDLLSQLGSGFMTGPIKGGKYMHNLAQMTKSTQGVT